MSSTLKTLDEEIARVTERITEGEAKAIEKREALVGGGGPAVNSDEFKSATDELSAVYRGVDEARDTLTALKSQRAVVGRTIGTPAARDGEGGGGDGDDLLAGAKGIDPAMLAEALRAAGKGRGSDGPSIGDRITTSAAYKSLASAGTLTSTARMGHVALGKGLDRDELKALITGGPTSAGAFKDPEVMPYEALAQRDIQLLAAIQTIPVSTDSVKYVQQILAGHNVRVVPDPTTAEPIDGTTVTAAAGGLKPESTYTFAVRTADIETLAHFLPVHRNQLADVPQLGGILDGEMRYGLYEYLERQVIAGPGGTDNLTGILNTTGIVEQLLGADNVLVAIHKIITGIRLGFNEPTLIAMSPRDWEVIRLLRDGSGGTPDSGGFLFGPPSQTGVGTLWGKPVLVTAVVPDGQPVVGDWSKAQLYLREGVAINATDSHEGFFRRNLVALLAETRAGLGVRRPAAFGTLGRRA